MSNIHSDISGQPIRVDDYIVYSTNPQGLKFGVVTKLTYRSHDEAQPTVRAVTASRTVYGDWKAQSGGDDISVGMARSVLVVPESIVPIDAIKAIRAVSR